MTEQEIRRTIARAVGTRIERVNLEAVVSEDETTVVRCKVSGFAYMAVMQDGYSPQIYRRIET